MTHPSSNTNALGEAPWQLTESKPDASLAAVHESLFALGNGRIGVRGAHEEGACWPGTQEDAIYINGFYDVHPIQYPENAYGLARNNQYMVCVPNGKALQWSIDGERFDARTGTIDQYQRTFDFRTGLLTREFVWTSPRGVSVKVWSQRLVSFQRKSVYALSFALTPLNAAAHIVMESSIDARPRELAASDDPRVGSTLAGSALTRVALVRGQDQLCLTHQTRHSGLSVASCVVHVARLEGQELAAGEACGGDDCPGQRFSATVPRGSRVTLEKMCALVTSRDQGAEDLQTTALQRARLACSSGFDGLKEEQAAFLDAYWQDADIAIDGNSALQQGVRFNVLHLLQSVGRDGHTNIAAKGLTGCGYDGHYFWDTEIYVFPMMLHTQPAIARKLLEFRYNTLDAARARAREMSHQQGALFPWRTIAGEECSSYFPAGTAQYHINADIAYAVKRYWDATGDDAFMRECGTELVLETARIWMDLGHFEPTNPARFSIHAVTGPDEYTAIVNNNLYTNAMAQMHLRFAAHIVDWLEGKSPIALAEQEAAQWRRAADAMYLPYDPALGIHPQDDGFLAKPRWPAASITPQERPLLNHFHPLVIYRHQVCKQADVLLAMMLLSDQFALADKKRNFDYYEPLTTHDSSLSRCVFGVVASEIGEHAKAYQYFHEGVRTDLDNLHHNTDHGVHTAAMAGSWHGVVAGFGGLRMHQQVPVFNPTLPQAWSGYSFKLRFGDRQLQVSVKRNACTYRLVRGSSLSLLHCGQSVVLTAERPEAVL